MNLAIIYVCLLLNVFHLAKSENLRETTDPHSQSYKSGYTDIIVTQDPNNGQFLSTQFNLSFGLANYLGAGTEVKLKVNGHDVSAKMSIDKEGFIISSEGSYYPTSAFISSLGLKKGKNEVSFTISYLWAFSKEIAVDVYFYDKGTKFVVSDVDGTVTKSDVLGVVLPFFDVDWTQEGVAKLFTDIKSQGYEIIYLSAKTFIAQNSVKRYFKWVNQNGSRLPEGPLVNYPKGIVDDIEMELYGGTAKYKTEYMRRILSMFPDSIHFGFGNAPSDKEAYLNVNLPLSRISMVNEKGVVTLDTRQTSYTQMDSEVESLFPKV